MQSAVTSVAVLLCGLTLAGGAAAQTESITRTTSWTYDATGLAASETVEPGSATLEVTSNYTRDGFGNKTGVTVATPTTGWSWVESRTSTVSYDAQGRFATGAANALGHGETREFDPRTGVVKKLIGPNGLSTTWTYDQYGRKTEELRADNTKSVWQYGYCPGIPVTGAELPTAPNAPSGVPACPALAVSWVSSWGKDTSGATMSAFSIVYLDLLGREVQVATQVTNGSGVAEFTLADTVYDNQGQVLKKSEPYFVGTANANKVWRAYVYDRLGRVKSELHSVQDGDLDGTERVGFWRDGLTVTAETTRDGTAVIERRVTVKNSQSQEVEIIDNVGGKTNFTYDAFGNLTKTVVTAKDALGDAQSITTTISYDPKGYFKTGMVDPDKGSWTYVTNVLGQVVQQRDAKGQTTEIYYDKLGRTGAKIVKVGGVPERTDYWAYDTSAHGVGKLAAVASVDGLNTVTHQRGYTYDALGRILSTAEAADGSSFYVGGAHYDAVTGRLKEAIYPSGLRVGYEYSASGELSKVKNNATGVAFWTLEGRNAAGQLTKSRAGNGVVTERTYTPTRGFVKGIYSYTTSSMIQELDYEWDNIGNMTAREVDYIPGLQGYREVFEYDTLNRLTGSTLTGKNGLSDTVTVAYDGFGNIIGKSDKGIYAYDFASQPHAVKEVEKAGAIASYAYDNNGNLVTGGGRRLTWTGFNQPASITGPNASVSFAYDGSQSRIKQVNPTATKYYYQDTLGGGNRSERSVNTMSGLTNWTDQIMADGELVATVETPETQIQTTLYMHSDHLGSIQAVTNSSGAKVESFDFDVWGARRVGGLLASDNQGAVDPAQSITWRTRGFTDRGFTGHEMLDDVGLVHMNGRLYDAQLARFVAADNLIVDAADTQSYGRYSYVRNSPLTATDPSGWMEDGGLGPGEDPTDHSSNNSSDDDNDGDADSEGKGSGDQASSKSTINDFDPFSADHLLDPRPDLTEPGKVYAELELEVAKWKEEELNDWKREQRKFLAQALAYMPNTYAALVKDLVNYTQLPGYSVPKPLPIYSPTIIALVTAIMTTPGIKSVGIGFSTNGKHSTNSLHYTGLAVDINYINGISVGVGRTPNPKAADLVEALQYGAFSVGGIVQNFGPAVDAIYNGTPNKGYWGGVTQETIDAHLNHVHFGVR